MTFTPNVSEQPTNTVAYLRVSTNSQDLEKNKADILDFANSRKLGHVTFIGEKVSSKVSWKDRKIGEIVEGAEKGDNIIVSEVSRLGRNMSEIFNIADITYQKGVSIYSVKDNMVINDDTVAGKSILFALSISAQIEKEMISARTKEALRALKASGRSLGRPRGVSKSKLDKYELEIHSMIATGTKQTYIAKKYGISPVGLHLWLKKHPVASNKTLKRYKVTVTDS